MIKNRGALSKKADELGAIVSDCDAPNKKQKYTTLSFIQIT